MFVTGSGKRTGDQQRAAEATREARADRPTRYWSQGHHSVQETQVSIRLGMLR